MDTATVVPLGILFFSFSTFDILLVSHPNVAVPTAKIARPLRSKGGKTVTYTLAALLGTTFFVSLVQLYFNYF